MMCRNVFNVGPKTTLLLPVWPRDTQRLDTPGTQTYPAGWINAENVALCQVQCEGLHKPQRLSPTVTGPELGIPTTPTLPFLDNSLALAVGRAFSI